MSASDYMDRPPDLNSMRRSAERESELRRDRVREARLQRLEQISQSLETLEGSGDWEKFVEMAKAERDQAKEQVEAHLSLFRGGRALTTDQLWSLRVSTVAHTARVETIDALLGLPSTFKKAVEETEETGERE